MSVSKDQFIAIAKEEGLDDKLIQGSLRLWNIESGQGTNTKDSIQGAVGNMQVMRTTWPDILKLPSPSGKSISNIDDVEDNIRGGLRYLKQGYDKSGGDVFRAAAYYHGGPNTLKESTAQLAARKDGLGTRTLDYAKKVSQTDPEFGALYSTSVNVDLLGGRLIDAQRKSVDVQTEAARSDATETSRILQMFGLKTGQSENVAAIGARIQANNTSLLQLQKATAVDTNNPLDQLIIGFGREKVFEKELGTMKALSAENDVLTKSVTGQVRLAEELAKLNVSGNADTRAALVNAQGNYKLAESELDRAARQEQNDLKRLNIESQIKARDAKTKEEAQNLDQVNANLEYLGATKVDEAGWKDLQKTNRSLAAVASASNLKVAGSLAGVLQNPEGAKKFYRDTKLAPTGKEAGQLFLRPDSYYTQAQVAIASKIDLKDPTPPSKDEINARAGQQVTNLRNVRLDTEVYNPEKPADNLYGANAPAILLKDTTIPQVLKARETILGSKLITEMQAKLETTTGNPQFSDRDVLDIALASIPDYFAAGKNLTDLSKDVAKYFDAAVIINNNRWKFEEAGIAPQQQYIVNLKAPNKKNKNAIARAPIDVSDPADVLQLITATVNAKNTTTGTQATEAAFDFNFKLGQ